MAPIELGVEYQKERAYLKIKNNRATENFVVKLESMEAMPAARLPIRLPWKDGSYEHKIIRRDDEWIDLGSFVADRDNEKGGWASYVPTWNDGGVLRFEQPRGDKADEWVPVVLTVRVVADLTGRRRRSIIRMGARFSPGRGRGRELFVEVIDMVSGVTQRRSNHIVPVPTARVVVRAGVLAALTRSRRGSGEGSHEPTE
jgi:hypothetical protein